MILHVLAVGRVKNEALRSCCADYERRIGRYVKLRLRELRDGGRRDRDAADARRLEGNAILDALPGGSVTIALTRAGTASSSREFATLIGKWQQEGRDAAFVIGGAHGLDQDVLDRSDYHMSLSAMTLPHELARLNLLEQLYRACTILRGEPYHKGG